MAKLVWVIGLCGSLATAGCALPPGSALNPTTPTALDPTPIASNELNRLGRADLDAGNSGLAEEHFRKAVEQNSEDWYSWVGLAAAYDNLKRFDLADRAYREAIRIRGETPTIINDRGYSYYLRGDTGRALVELRRAEKLDPRNPVILNNIRLVLSGEQANRRTAP